MHRFLCREGLSSSTVLSLPAEEARHAAQVLRLRSGALVELIDGVGGVFAAEVVDIDKQHVSVRVGERLASREALTRVTLYQGLPKGDKLETIVKRCTELGIDAVVPVLFARCDKMPAKQPEKQLVRLSRIALEATKQCGRGRLPRVEMPICTAELGRRIAAHACVLVPWEEARDVRIAQALEHSSARDIAIVIGPEGGIAPEEMDAMRAQGATAVTLGPRILRTETAGPAALSAILTLMGDM